MIQYILPRQDHPQRRIYIVIRLFGMRQQQLSDVVLQKCGVPVIIVAALAEAHLGARLFSKSDDDRLILKQAAFLGSLIPAAGLFLMSACLTVHRILFDNPFDGEHSHAENLMAVAKQYPGRSHLFLIGLFMMSSVCGYWIQQYQEWPTLALSDYLLVSGVAAVFSQLVVGSIGFMAYKVGVVPEEQRQDLSLWQFFGLPDRKDEIPNDNESLERG